MKNWLYNTIEDLIFYPSYGDTYPMYNGAVGIDHGNKAEFVPIEKLRWKWCKSTIKERLTHHKTAVLAVVETSASGWNYKRLEIS